MITKSVSVQNLENLVRQTINVVPENNEDTIKFHQMIYEKWYFKRSFKSKSRKSEQNHTKPRISSEQNISATTAYHKSRQSKHRINQSSHEIQRLRTNVESVENVVQNNLNLPQNVKSPFPRNNIPDSNNSQLDQVELFSTDPTKIIDCPSVDVNSKVIAIRNRGKQRMKGSKNTRNNVLDVACTRNRNVGALEPQRKAGKKLISFEAWKKSKTIAHRKILKQLEKEKHKKQQQHQRAQTYSNCEQIKGKRVKFDKDKVPTLTTIRKSDNKNGNRKKQTTSTYESVIFDSWLDQLNWVLHKKYLRERRHLVRSYYCQPFYYGDATLYVT